MGTNWGSVNAVAARSSVVTVVRDQNVLDAGFAVDATGLQKMLEHTLLTCTGQKNSKDAWLSLVTPENSAKLGKIWNLPEVKGKTKLVLVDALYPLCDKGPPPDPRY